MNELANIDINSVVTTCNSLAEVISSSQGLSALSIILGFSGYSLRDLKGRFNLAKFVEKFKKELPEGTKNETQESILSNSLVELQDYIKNNENLDDNVFEKIGDTIINGIKTEDMLTREYIRILKKLSWIDLSIFLKAYLSIKNNISNEENILIKKLNYPVELIRLSLEKLNTYKLLKVSIDSAINKVDGKIFYKTELGAKLFSLINGEGNYEK